VGFDVFGLTDAEARGVRFIDFVHLEDRDKTIEAGRYMAETLQPVYGLTNRQWTQSGWRLFEWNSTPLVGPDGRYAGHQGTGRDVTDECRQDTGG
jgi:PAS domain-containing protein